MKTTNKATTNILKHKIYCKDVEGNDLIISICLDDDCNNGHNDFSITGDTYAAGKPRTDRNHLTGGCIHETILAARPDLKRFIDLHLANVNGVPMYAIANGFYHMKEGKMDVAQDHFRATAQEMETIRTAEDELHLKYILTTLGIPERWKMEADEAITALENMIGVDVKFQDDSTRLEVVELTSKERKLITQRLSSGYYTPKQLEERETAKVKAKIEAQFAEILAERNKDIAKVEGEYQVKRAILLAGLPLDNFIYYNHSNEGAFNWKDYDKKITKAQFDGFLEFIEMNEVDPSNGRKFKSLKDQMPQGIKFKMDQKKDRM